MGKLLSPVHKQFLTVISCNILTFSIGLSSGWATINLPELENKNNTFPFSLTKKQASLLVSFQYLGSILGNYLTIPISQVLGAKRTIHLFGIPMTISPFLIIWAKNVYFLYISRILIGMTYGALIIILPVLISEMCFDKVRGALNAFPDFMKNFGIVCSFWLGDHFNCIDQAEMQLIPLIIFMVTLFFMPNTPEYWINRKKKQRAIKSNRFYKGSNATLNMPNETVFRPLKQNERDVQNCEDGLENIDDVSNSKLKFSDFYTRHAKKSCFIVFGTQILCNLSGGLLIASFITNIFKETGSILSEKDSSILIAVIQLIANLVFLLIVERFNRKTLYVWSSLLTTASYGLFIVYGFFWSKQPEFEWMPPICFGLVFFFGSIGILPLPYIMAAEILPKKIRKPCFSFFATTFWIQMFLYGSIFLTLVDIIGINFCMIAFCFVCILNALFAIFYFPETRGKSFEEIEEIMMK